MFVSDGERGIEEWLGRLAKANPRCQWCASREVGYALWEDDMPRVEREAMQRRVSRLLAVEVPEEDVEFVSEAQKQALKQRIQEAENKSRPCKRSSSRKGIPKPPRIYGGRETNSSAI